MKEDDEIKNRLEFISDDEDPERLNLLLMNIENRITYKDLINE